MKMTSQRWVQQLLLQLPCLQQNNVHTLSLACIVVVVVVVVVVTCNSTNVKYCLKEQFFFCLQLKESGKPGSLVMWALSLTLFHFNWQKIYTQLEWKHNQHWKRKQTSSTRDHHDRNVQGNSEKNDKFNFPYYTKIVKVIFHHRQNVMHFKLLILWIKNIYFKEMELV